MLKPGIQKLTKQTVRDLAAHNDLLHEIAAKAMHGELTVTDDAELQKRLVALGEALEAAERSLQCECMIVAKQVEV